MVTIDDVRAVAGKLPRSYEVLVGGRVKFRVGRIVYLSFSRDETIMGFAFPKEERDWLIGGSPDKFLHPSRADLRYNWVLARLAALDKKEMRELVLDAWRMVVPKGVANRTTTSCWFGTLCGSNGFACRPRCTDPRSELGLRPDGSGGRNAVAIHPPLP